MYYSYVMGIDNRIMELVGQGFDIQNDGVEDGIKRYEVYNYENNEVLILCEKLCKCKFESIRAMLVGNHFYKKVLEQ